MIVNRKINGTPKSRGRRRIARAGYIYSVMNIVFKRVFRYGKRIFFIPRRGISAGPRRDTEPRLTNQIPLIRSATITFANSAINFCPAALGRATAPETVEKRRAFNGFPAGSFVIFVTIELAEPFIL